LHNRIAGLNDDIDEFRKTHTLDLTWYEHWWKWVEEWDAFKKELDDLSDTRLFWTAATWGDRVDSFEGQYKKWRSEFITFGGKPTTPEPTKPGFDPEEYSSLFKWGAIGLVAIAAIVLLKK